MESFCSGRSAGASTTPIGGPAPASDFVLPCVDYSGVFDPAHASLITAPIYVYDSWLNVPSAGTSVSLGNVSSQKLASTSYGIGTYAESWGSMGILGFDFDYRPVAASGASAGKECTIANGQACVDKLLFRTFSNGFSGTAAIQNGVPAPANGGSSPPPLGVSTTGFGCAPNPDQYGSGGFILEVDVTNAHSTKIATPYTGLYAHGF